MTPNIRPVQEKDLPQLHHMICALAAHHGDTPDISPTTLARVTLGAQPWFHVLVADGQAGALLGYAALLPLGQLQFGARGMDLHHLFVRQAHRGTGLGSALIEGCIAKCQRLGCRAMTVGTHPENSAAAAFYERRGFGKHAHTGPRFLMWLDQPPT